MRVAALDLGSNTSLLLIAEVKDGALREVIVDETTITKLGQGVHANRKFHPDALERMRVCLGRYSKLIQQHNCEKVVAVATSAARDVSNGQELIDMAKNLGIPVHIIEGRREAELTFKGAVSDRGDHRGIAVIDVGGGSTEIIFNQKEIKGQSIDVGSVRLTEMFVSGHPVSADEIQKISAYVAAQFAKANFDLSGVKEVIAVAGTPTTLAAVDQRRDFEENLVNGYRLSTKTIEAWIEKMAQMSVEEREKLPGMQPKRADVIVTGSLILLGAIKALKQTEVTVSTRGVRYGVALAWQEF